MHAWENFLGLPDHTGFMEQARAHILPVPFEQTSTFGTGSLDGPAAVLTASHHVELFDTTLGFEPLEAGSKS